jgi:hypothetical protein
MTMKADPNSRRQLLGRVPLAAFAAGSAARGAESQAPGKFVTPPPAASCIVYKNPAKQRVFACRWNAGAEAWETIADGESGKADAAVLQTAYDHLPERGGRLLVQGEEYRLDRTITMRRSYTEVAFEKGAVLKPASSFTDFLIDMGSGVGWPRAPRVAESINISGLRIEGEKRCNGVKILGLINSDHYDWRIAWTRGEALWLQESAIEQGFYGLHVCNAGVDRKSSSIRIGCDKKGVDHANNVCFVNFRLQLPIGPLLIDCPPGEGHPVRNIYFFGSQVHWVMPPPKREQDPERFDVGHSAVDLIKILAGHDIHFMGGNFQFMHNRGRFIVLGGTERVSAVTIKGLIWGGGPGSTAISVVDAEDLYLPCTIRFPLGTALDWGKSAPRLQEPPQVLEGDVRGEAPDVAGRSLGPIRKGDYGGSFARLTLPEGREGMLLSAADLNVANPGKRIYTYLNGGWSYVDLR